MSDPVTRSWGYYRVLHTVGPHVKVKELTVNPGMSLSMQRHEKREEYWFVAEGIATIKTLKKDCVDHLGDFGLHTSLNIELGEWHQLSNEQTFPLKIIEIQYGLECIEDDIERKNA